MIPPPTARERASLLALLAVYAVAALLHAWRLPLFEGPDEPGNLLYLRFLAEEGRLARPTVEIDPELEVLDRGILPPLWFALSVPVFELGGMRAWSATPTPNPDFLRRGPQRDGRPLGLEEALALPSGRMHYLHGRDERSAWAGAAGALRALRLTNLVWGVLAIYATWSAARLACAGRAFPALGAAALIALNPQFQHLSGTITMDIALAAFGSVALWAGCAWASGQCSPARAALAAGACTGLAALTKLNGLVLVPMLAVAWWIARGRGRGSHVSLAAALGALALVAGPWYAWGWIESGHPLWMWKYQAISPYHNPAADPGGLELWTALGARLFAQTLFLTWIADFGWAAVWFPTWIVILAACFYAAGGLGFGLPRRRSATSSGRPAGESGRAIGRDALGFLAIGAALILAAEVYFNLRFAQPQARHLYPFLPALAVVLALGLERWRLLALGVALHGVLSVAAFPVLLERLRPEGWNEDPRWAATDAARRPDASLVPGTGAAAASAASTIRWLAPAHASVHDAGAPPRLEWDARAGALYDLVLAVDNPKLVYEPWDALRMPRRASCELGMLPAAPFDLPASLWSALAPGARVYAQVIEIDGEGRAAARSTLLTLVRGP